MMGQHGELTAFDLIEETVKDGARVRVYRATFGTTPLRAVHPLAGRQGCRPRDFAGQLT